MIGPNRSSKMAWDLLFAISLVGVVVASWFAFVKPKPLAAAAKDPKVAAKAMDVAAADIEKGADAAEQQVKDRVWDATPEVLGSKVLDLLTRIANANHLQITDVRSERLISAAGLRQAPYVVLVEGAFPDVIAGLEALEETDSKIAVSQIKIAANNSGRVTATFGITGFLKQEGA
jgi:hypothetical protein